MVTKNETKSMASNMKQYLSRFNAVSFAGVLTAFVPIGLVIGNVASDAAVSLIAILFLFESVRTKEFNWIKKPWITALILLWAYGCARSIVVLDLQSLGRGAPWIRFVLFAAALEGWVLKEEKWRKWLFNSSMIASGFLAADALLQYFRGTDILGFPPVGMRLTATFFKKQIVGTTIAWLFLPVLAGLIGQKKIVPAIIYAALCFTAIFLSGERGALLFALSALFLVTIFEAKLRKPAIMALVAISIIAGSAMYYRPSLYERQIKSTVESIEKIGDTHYGIIWTSALKISRDYPIFGVGILNFRKVCPDERYGPPDVMTFPRCVTHPHNIYIEWLVETGVVGLLGFLIFGFLLMRRFICIFPANRGDYIFLALFASVIIRLFPFSTSSSFHHNWFAIPLWLAIGWGLSYGAREPNNKI